MNYFFGLPGVADLLQGTGDLGPSDSPKRVIPEGCLQIACPLT
jgi:hypothetical protein